MRWDWFKPPIKFRGNISSEKVQSSFIFSRTPPFAIHVGSPLAARSCQSGVVVFHSNKRATGDWVDIRLTAEVLDYSFTSAVSDRGHMERTSLLFTAVESQLSERQVSPQLIHGTLRQIHLVVMVIANSPVGVLYWQLRWRGWAVSHIVGDKKPASWNQVNLWLLIGKNKTKWEPYINEALRQETFQREAK